MWGGRISVDTNVPICVCPKCKGFKFMITNYPEPYGHELYCLECEEWVKEDELVAEERFMNWKIG